MGNLTMPGCVQSLHVRGSYRSFSGGLVKRLRSLIVISLATLTISACDTAEQSLSLGLLSATLVGGQAPTHEIEQIYYVGSLDPQGQLEPQMYRIRVHGQASFLSFVDFASGWVPAGVIDSLSTKVHFNQSDGAATTTNGAGANAAVLEAGRRLVQFGPEGFRTAPADHRLVIVMGTDPSEFFSAVDNSLGAVAEARNDQRNNALTRELFSALIRAQTEGQRLAEVQQEIVLDIPEH